MSRRARLGFLAACLLAFALIVVFFAWSAPPKPSRTSPTVTLASGATQPAGLTVTDLKDTGGLKARFNADKGTPRLVLSLAPT